MKFREYPVVFPCEGEQLVGIVSVPEQPAGQGVVIVVGGPQYRAGSHRQFTLLARALAANGIAAVRFDYRGMGDSEGNGRSFENVSADIRAATDQLITRVPQVREAALWGLCDAASAALFYAHRDMRVTGLVLCNPWVRTEAGAAKTQLKHYYGARLVDPQFWTKLARGDLKLWQSGCEFLRGLRMATRAEPSANPDSRASLPERMAESLERFDGKVLLLISGNDLTAAEFCDVARASAKWSNLLAAPRLERFDLSDADHTFSRAQWRTVVEDRTVRWLLGT